MSGSSIVEAHGIRKEFPNMTAPVLDDVSIRVGKVDSAEHHRMPRRAHARDLLARRT